MLTEYQLSLWNHTLQTNATSVREFYRSRLRTTTDTTRHKLLAEPNLAHWFKLVCEVQLDKEVCSVVRKPLDAKLTQEQENGSDIVWLGNQQFPPTFQDTISLKTGGKPRQLNSINLASSVIPR